MNIEELEKRSRATFEGDMENEGYSLYGPGPGIYYDPRLELAYRWYLYGLREAGNTTQSSPDEPLDREAISNAALDSVLEIVQHARDNICAGGLAENRQHEESVVHPYLDGICDEIDSLKSQPAQHPDDAAVDAFAAAMKAKLAKKRAEGYGGWNTSECTQEMLSAMLRNHVSKGDPVDVGNLAMMLHQRGEGIQPAQPSDSQAEPSDTEISTKAVEAAMTEWLEDKERTLFESMRSAIKAALKAEKEQP